MVVRTASGGGRFEKIGAYSRAKRVGPFVFVAGTTAVEPRMASDEVGDAVLHMANLPLSTNVQFMTIMATKMPYIGRG